MMCDGTIRRSPARRRLDRRPDVKAFIKGLPAWRKFAGLVTLLAILLALHEGNWLVFWLFVGAITISAIWQVVKALRREGEESAEYDGPSEKEE